MEPFDEPKPASGATSVAEPLGEPVSNEPIIRLEPQPVMLDLQPPASLDVPAQVEKRGFFRRVGSGIASTIGWLFGSISLIITLAVLASIPILQFLSLGYLLEAAGRIARSGRVRDGFPGVRLASRLGGIALGTWLVTVPWRLMSLAVIDAELIDPSSVQTLWMQRILATLTVLTPIHVVLALLRGGRLRYFFAPLNLVWFCKRIVRGNYFGSAWNSVVATVRDVQPVHYFWLGVRGYVGALLWLVLPSRLYAIGTTPKTAVLGILGGILMTFAVLYVPFLQVHFAAENRFRAMFELREVRKRFIYSPIAFFISFLFALIVVLPLHLLKIELVPRDAMWLPALVFIVTIFPLKVMTGWAYGRSRRREAAEKRTWFVTRLACRTLMVPVALFYALIVFFTQYTGWHGVKGLYEHHAFLLPVPF